MSSANLQSPAAIEGSEAIAELETRLQCRFGGRIHHFRLIAQDTGLILRGRSSTYYAKQLAQHAVMEATELPILANEIEVSCFE
jgi:hypothetical protein